MLRSTRSPVNPSRLVTLFDSRCRSIAKRRFATGLDAGDDDGPAGIDSLIEACEAFTVEAIDPDGEWSSGDVADVLCRESDEWDRLMARHCFSRDLSEEIADNRI